jgi:hypothetical protein
LVSKTVLESAAPSRAAPQYRNSSTANAGIASKRKTARIDGAHGTLQQQPLGSANRLLRSKSSEVRPGFRYSLTKSLTPAL